MRVAVHHPARTEEDGTEVPESVSAYRQGRIADFVHPITGEVTPQAEVAELLVAAAQEEFPGLKVEIQRLVHNGDAPDVVVERSDGSTETISDPHGEGGTSTWVHHEQVPEGARSPKGGVISAPVLNVEQAAEAGGGEAQ